jgi:hypothetical protein
MVPSFDFQINNVDQHKTLNQIVEEAFSVKKQVVDLSFFYEEKPKDIETPEVNKVETQIPFLKLS